ncbi:hypothetical protein SERLA73DRAFT_181388 [Serpula lacrymans var. lacrymans S7.3]|uniref:Uncharacterized protein n=1 Tax=Serpula lacrymans var. lacrymans (strain S7.3) TaxID=936435 RepID=F8PXZ2_SERL3|nr:hypothetical protein SERLA73DRAFT_181388 [Serpula lacrymans var. lacrymans S7.3]
MPSMVLAHLRRTSRSFSRRNSFILQLYIISLVCISFLVQPAFAQVYINGQFITKALAIIDSPAPNSQIQAGSSSQIAIEVDGDGNLTSAMQLQELQIYLISYANQINMTVSDSPSILTQEAGSTVKHVNWTVPSCLPAGSYNLTFYENSIIKGQSYYSITPLPIDITSSSSSQCTSDNQLITTPQASSPPSQSPWLAALYTSSSSYLATQSGFETVLSGATTFTIVSPGEPPPITVTVGTAAPSTVTVVMVSLETLTTTISDKPSTTTVTSKSTTTMTMAAGTTGGMAGFVPVNTASLPSSARIALLWAVLVASTMLTVFLRA